MDIETQSSSPSLWTTVDTPRVSSGMLALPYHIVQTARWNNEAAATLLHNSSNSMNPHTIAAAHQQLVAALELAKRGHATNRKDDAKDDIDRPVVWQEDEVSRPPLPHAAGQQDATGGGGSYLYTRPLWVTTRDLMKDDDNDALFSKLSFVLMFNLALCNHLLALPQQQDTTTRHAETRKRRLSSAIRLYELTLELNVLEDDDDADDTMMMIAMTALWNNLAVAYQQHQQQQQLQAHALPPSHPYQSIILERLVCAVMYLVDTTSLRSDEDQDDSYRTEAIQGFLSNVLPFLAPGGSDAITAPAA